MPNTPCLRGVHDKALHKSTFTLPYPRNLFLPTLGSFGG